MESKIHIVDVANRTLGRAASEIASLLRGKDSPDFRPNKDPESSVLVKNINKMRFSGKKTQKKIYYHHSGYLGGLKETPLKKILDEKGPAEVLKRAVYGMLPTNKLRARQIKRLKFEDKK